MILLLAFIPALTAAGLPIRFSWADYFVVFWVKLAFSSTLLAGCLFLLQWPGNFWAWLKREPSKAPMSDQLKALSAPLISVLLPSLYMFLGLVLVMGYNDVIAALRFTGSADVLLNRVDSFLLSGHSISSLAHYAAAHFPYLYNWLGPIYRDLDPIMGSCMILLALRSSRTHSIQFVASVLTAYYLALIFFYFIPATGPYYVCSTHELMFPGNLGMYTGQVDLSARLNVLRAHQSLNVVGLDYYIAIPSMHLAQPLIALWFVRHWNRIAALLLAYNVILIPTILLLEQHYVVDLMAAIVVAGAAIALVESCQKAEGSVRVEFLR
jgi:hypothetical protein